MRNDRSRTEVRALALLLAATLAACGAEGSAPVGASAPGPTDPAVADPDAELDRAWRLLEVDRRPDEADAALRALAEDPSVPRRVRGRAILGCARVARLRDDRPRAEALLRRVREEFGDLPGLRTESTAEAALLAGSSTRWVGGLLVVHPGQFLDLDSCGIFGAPRSPAGGAAEVAGRTDGVEMLVAATFDAAFEEIPAWISPAPWRRVTTDMGSAAWIQVLESGRRGTGGGSWIRWYTRTSGTGAPLPGPRNAFCLGRGDAIEVHFAEDPRYESYRVESRPAFDAPFDEVREVRSGPVVFAEARSDSVRGFRITGRTPAGDEGLPVIVQGTTASRGIRTGSAVLEAGRPSEGRHSLDFATGAVGPSGDLTLVAMYGNASSAGIEDSSGRRLAGTPEPGRSAWPATGASEARLQVPGGDWIAVPIRGGGIARARIDIDGGARTVVLDWEANPDADSFPEPWTPRVETVEGAPTRIAITGLGAGWRVVELVAEDLRAGDGPPRTVPVGDGIAVDEEGLPGTILRYTGRAVDSLGRSGVTVSFVVRRVEAAVHEGEFEFHYGQSWSFDRESLVAARDADLSFARCAGGISSVTLRAPGGIATLAEVAASEEHGSTVEALLEAVARVDPAGFRGRPEGHGDSRRPSSDVGVVRTRLGGWVKYAVAGRARDGNWQTRPIRIRYAYNPGAPIFREGVEPASWAGGIGLAVEPPDGAFQRALARVRVEERTEEADATVRRLATESHRIRFRGAPLTALGEFLTERGFRVRLDPDALDVSLSMEVAAGVPLLEGVLHLVRIGYEVRVERDGTLVVVKSAK
jgi:hypothetical protein